jgi:hypothetical protein
MSEFVSREEFDALLDRVAALENGTTSSVVAKISAPRTRGTRLPENWLPRGATIDKMGIELDVREDVLAWEHRRFVDYWLSAPGQKGVKLDWDRAWCNWMRRAAENGQLRRGVGMCAGDQPMSKVDLKVLNLQASKEPE